MVKVIDNTEPNKPIDVGTIFKCSEYYYMIVNVEESGDKMFGVLNLTNHKVSPNYWHTIDGLLSEYDGAIFYNNNTVEMIID